MPCSLCAAPLFAVEQPLSLCRTHGLAGTTLHDGLAVLRLDGSVEVEPWYRRDRINSLRDLGSILPPIPERGMSVRMVHRVLTPSADDLAQIGMIVGVQNGRIDGKLVPLRVAVRDGIALTDEPLTFDRTTDPRTTLNVSDESLFLTAPAVDPVTRQVNGERRALRLVEMTDKAIGVMGQR